MNTYYVVQDRFYGEHGKVYFKSMAKALRMMARMRSIKRAKYRYSDWWKHIRIYKTTTSNKVFTYDNINIDDFIYIG